MTLRTAGLLTATCALAAACGSSPTAPSPVATGLWGGAHVAMTVTANATHFEFDCAHGDVPDDPVMDARGQFDSNGTYTREHGGPIRIGEPPDVHPARYTGTVAGQTMVLVVTLTDTGESIGTFTLAYGSSGAVVKCLLPLALRAGD